MPPSNPAVELRKARQKRQRAAEQAARTAQLTESQLEKQAKRKAQLAQVREERLAREAAEAEAARKAMREREAERAALEAAQMEKRKSEFLATLHANPRAGEEEEAQAAPSRKRVRAAPPPESAESDDTKHGNASLDSDFFQPPRTLIDALEREELPASMPATFDDVVNTATHRVMCAAPECVGVWGESVGDGYDAVSRWTQFCGVLTETLVNRKTNGMKCMYGEYNFVVTGPELVRVVAPACPIPPIMDVDGKAVDADDLVFRITRPSVDRSNVDVAEAGAEAGAEAEASTAFRYRPLKDAAAEMYHVLHAAYSGFGMPCYAALLFPAQSVLGKSGRAVQLYGSLYVLKRGATNLNALVTERVRQMNAKYATNLARAKRGVGSGVHDFALQNVLPKLVRQARNCILNFDCKPSNLMVCANKQVFLIDFDASMYALANSFMPWHSCLMVNLLLLCAHSRCSHVDAFASEFTRAFRPLMLELLPHARSQRWLFDAKVCNRAFFPGVATTPDRAQYKLESIVNCYFTDLDDTECKLLPRLVSGQPLLPQLVKFALTGSSISTDPEILKALGG